MFFFIVSRLFQLWKERQISCDAMIYVSCSLFQKGEKRWNSEMISLKCFLHSENCPSRWPSTSPSMVAQAVPAAALCLGSYSVWGQCLRSVFEVTCSLDTGRWRRWFKEAQKDGRGIPENKRTVLPVWVPLFWVKEQLVLSRIPLLAYQVKWYSLGRFCGGRRWHLMENWNSSVREDPQRDDNSNLLSFTTVQVLHQVLCKRFM